MAIFNAQRARDLREQRGLTREEFAADIGKSFSTVVRVERAEVRPSLTTLGEMARALDCSVADFFDEDDPDLLADDDPRPSDLGADVDEWIKAVAASMPPMAPDVARRVSTVLFRSTHETSRRKVS